MVSLSSFTAKSIDGTPVKLREYADQVVLIVNTASKCGFTSQYAELQKLYETYRSRGFVVLAFPCNQFLMQESGTAEAIEEFCRLKYNVSFPLFDKIEVNGTGAHPLYAWLKSAATGLAGTTAIKWNFTKFLLDHSGTPVVRYAPTMLPQNIAPTIERLLARSPATLSPAQANFGSERLAYSREGAR
jgi:glutathione peroxidase